MRGDAIIAAHEEIASRAAIRTWNLIAHGPVIVHKNLCSRTMPHFGLEILLVSVSFVINRHVNACLILSDFNRAKYTAFMVDDDPMLRLFLDASRDSLDQLVLRLAAGPRFWNGGMASLSSFMPGAL